MFRIEEWRDIAGYEDKYQVSNLGNVKSLNYNNTGKERLLKPKLNRYGYNEVKLSKHNKTKNYLVATLVAQAFLGEKRAPDLQVMHIGDNSVDSVDNLRYAYKSEILHQMYKKGKRKIGKPTRYNISFNGKQYVKFSHMARDYGIEPKMFSKRLEHGWTLTEAILIPKERKEKMLKKKLYKYNDKLYSIKQLAKLSGKTEKTIRKRLTRGWSIEEAIEIPLGKKERGKKV